MNYEAIIGLEIHVEMKTKSKMFSSSPNSFSKEPNTHVAPLDMAFPGALPTVNKQAVIHGIRLAHSLHMRIERTLVFDRKNYFYADLPKGYQITQQFHPLGQDGYLTIATKDGEKKNIHIQRIHLEEDTCKQLHLDDYSLLDYNRCGIPLIEIVSGPDMRNGYEAARVVETIRNLVVYSGVSDGKIEEGSLRCDVNVSLRPEGSFSFGTKVEIKNIGSIKSIELALDYEISRQKQCYEKGIPVLQETMRFDEASGKTVPMRRKANAVDYKYFVEPNIAPICLSESFIEEAIRTCPELYEEKKERYLQMGLTQSDVSVVLADIALATYFEKALKEGRNAKILANFLIAEVNAYLNKKSVSISSFPLSPEALSEIASYQEDGYSHKQCVDVLNYCLSNQVSPRQAKSELHLEKQISDEEMVRGYVSKILDENPESIASFKAGKERAIGFLIGQVMKASEGKTSPAAVAKIMKEELSKR